MRLASYLFFLKLALGMTMVLPAPHSFASDGAVPPGLRGYVPGGWSHYGFSVGQDWEYFSGHVRQAQFAFDFKNFPRYWMDFRDGLPGPSRGTIRGFFPMSFRWELKDGRKFLLEFADVQRLTNESARRISVPAEYLQDQSPDRQQAFFPVLMIEVWDDLVILKWAMSIDVMWRSAAASISLRDSPKSPGFADVEYVIGKLKGTQKESLDFRRGIELSRVPEVAQ